MSWYLEALSESSSLKPYLQWFKDSKIYFDMSQERQIVPIDDLSPEEVDVDKPNQLTPDESIVVRDALMRLKANGLPDEVMKNASGFFSHEGEHLFGFYHLSNKAISLSKDMLSDCVENGLKANDALCFYVAHELGHLIEYGHIADGKTLLTDAATFSFDESKAEIFIDETNTMRMGGGEGAFGKCIDEANWLYNDCKTHKDIGSYAMERFFYRKSEIGKSEVFAQMFALAMTQKAFSKHNLPSSFRVVERVVSSINQYGFGSDNVRDRVDEAPKSIGVKNTPHPKM